MEIKGATSWPQGSRAESTASNGGQTTEEQAERPETMLESMEAQAAAREAAIAGRPQPSDAGARFPYQLDEAAKEAPFLIEAMWGDRFFTYIRTNSQKRIYLVRMVGQLPVSLRVTPSEDASLRFVQSVVRGRGRLRIGDEMVEWRYIRTEAAP